MLKLKNNTFEISSFHYFFFENNQRLKTRQKCILIQSNNVMDGFQMHKLWNWYIKINSECEYFQTSLQILEEKKSVKCRVWIDLFLNVENEEFK